MVLDSILIGIHQLEQKEVELDNKRIKWFCEKEQGNREKNREKKKKSKIIGKQMLASCLTVFIAGGIFIA